MRGGLQDWDRIVAHADMDSFYAAIEQLDDPGLRGRAVLVGPDSDRGVVLTASYEARPFGVGSAMPMAQARRLCPEAVIVPPRFKRYQAFSKTIMAVFSDFSPVVEPLSLDEAFLEMTGAEALFGDPENMGRRVKAAVREATGGLTVSVGLSGTKYVAKVASGFSKPDGLTVVPPAFAREWLAPLPVSKLWGAGKKTQARLEALGLRTIGEIADADPAFLTDRLGKMGAHFYSLSHATDPRRVEGRRGAKSMGSERTLSRDIRFSPELESHLRRSADTIARRLRSKGWVAAGVRVKLKTSGFQLLTRQAQLSEPTDVADILYSKGIELLPTFRHPGPFRLVGMAAFGLMTAEDPLQLDLLNAGERERRLESALDRIAERFGDRAIHRAGDLGTGLGPGVSPNLDFLDKEGRDEP